MAVVVPEFTIIRKHLKNESLSDEEICSREDIKKLILDDIVALSEKAQVSIVIFCFLPLSYLIIFISYQNLNILKIYI